MFTLPNLPQSVASDVLGTLCDRLPPPRSDTDVSRAARDEAAMAAVAALHPTDAFEALLAAQIVGADAHAKHCAGVAARPGQDSGEARRWYALSASMGRQMHAGLRALRRMQAEREKAEAEMHPAAMERAGYWFRDSSVPLPEPAQTEPPEPVVPSGQQDDDKFSKLTEAEQYAVIYPDRAIRIRANRGLPARLDFGPPEPALVEALVHGTSPILRALDDHPRTAAA